MSNIRKRDRTSVDLCVIKTFRDKINYENSKKIYLLLKGKNITPEFIDYNDRDQNIIIDYCQPLIEWLKRDDVYSGHISKMFVALRELLCNLQNEGVYHKDFHMGNIVVNVEDFSPRVIDFEFSEYDSDNEFPFIEEFDIAFKQVHHKFSFLNYFKVRIKCLIILLKILKDIMMVRRVNC